MEEMIVCEICGESITKGDTMAVLNHFLSQKHEEALAELEAKEEERWQNVNGAGKKCVM